MPFLLQPLSNAAPITSGGEKKYIHLWLIDKLYYDIIEYITILII